MRGVLAAWLLVVVPGSVAGVVAFDDHSRDQAVAAPSGYHLEAAAGAERRFTEDQLAILLRLNRVDLAHLTRLDTMVVPDRWVTDPLWYSPLPLVYAWASSRPKLLVVHQPAQAFGGYESGRLVRWGPVSSGRRDLATPPGLHHLTWKSEGHASTVNRSWFLKWYFNFHTERGLSFHAYPLPGRPASHACVRLLDADAAWLFTWGEEWTLDERGWRVLACGTPVLILGCYDFEAPSPWRSLSWLDAGLALPRNPELHPPPCGSSS